MARSQTKERREEISDWSRKWAQQVSLFQQGSSNEVNTLLSYRLLFTAMSVFFLTVGFDRGWNFWWGGFLGIGSLSFAILWYLACGRIAEWQDDWEAVLEELWSKAKRTDFPVKKRVKYIIEHHIGSKEAVEAREKRKNKIWKTIPFPPLDFNRPARMVFNLLIPILIMGFSGWIIIHCFFFYMD